MQIPSYNFYYSPLKFLKLLCLLSFIINLIIFWLACLFDVTIYLLFKSTRNEWQRNCAFRSKLIHRLIQSLENGIEGFGKIYLCINL
ncbi:hypothetical protein LINGRAHAP2_LOCUS29355 [Linum grandiflorum]